jgi:acid stress-induced BolA-like protein IbaG/YrbA
MPVMPVQEGGGGHYHLSIVSPRFNGLSMLERHRMIYELLGQLMHKEIHALRIDARASVEPSTRNLNDEDTYAAGLLLAALLSFSGLSFAEPWPRLLRRPSGASRDGGEG